MISPSQLNAVLGDSTLPRTAESFIHLHRHLEGYFKRVMLIGLRLHGAQYKTATAIVDTIHINAKDQIEKALVLLEVSPRKHQQILGEIKHDHQSVFMFIKLFTEFSSRFRNRLAHGVLDEIRDEVSLDLLFRVDQGLFLELESMLKTRHGHSALDKPNKWGAKPGTKDNIESLVDELKLGKFSPVPISAKAVLKTLESLGTIESFISNS